LQTVPVWTRPLPGAVYGVNTPLVAPQIDAMLVPVGKSRSG